MPLEFDGEESAARLPHLKPGTAHSKQQNQETWVERNESHDML
jgi:hypothetical protein